jgi:hypothetical protein
MTKRADLQRVRADLQEAQAEIENAATIDGSVADGLKFGFRSLLVAVGTLFAASDDHRRKIDEHDRQLKIALVEIADLQRRLHGLKVSRGKAIAAKERALTAIANAKGVLDQISLH